MDVYLDITDKVSLFSGIPGVTVNPPVTMNFVGTTTNQIVSDCFATDAETFADAFPEEVWTEERMGISFLPFVVFCCLTQTAFNTLQ